MNRVVSRSLQVLVVVSLAGPALAQTPPVPPVPPVAATPPVPPHPPRPHISFATPRPSGEGGPSKATASVRGAITLRLRTMSADIRVVTGPAGRVTVACWDGEGPVRVEQHGDRVEVELPSGARHHGSVDVEVPGGSGLELQSLSGDVLVRGSYGEVMVKTVSGDVSVDAATQVQVKSVSGDVRIDKATGETRVRTVSGSARVVGTRSDQRVSLETTSGKVEWRGTCARGCRLDAAAVSGDVEIMLDGKSSFELRAVSQSGDLVDRLGLDKPQARDRPGAGKRLEARYGKAEGIIDVSTYSGDFRLGKK